VRGALHVVGTLRDLRDGGLSRSFATGALILSIRPCFTIASTHGTAAWGNGGPRRVRGGEIRPIWSADLGKVARLCESVHAKLSMLRVELQQGVTRARVNACKLLEFN